MSKRSVNQAPETDEADDEEEYEDVHLRRKEHTGIEVASLDAASSTPLSNVHLNKNSAEYVNGQIREQRLYDSQDRTWLGCLFRLIRRFIYWFLMYLLPFLNYFCVGFGTVLVTIQAYQDGDGNMKQAFDAGAVAALGLGFYYFVVSVFFRWMRLKKSKESDADVLFVAVESLSFTDLFEIFASSIVIIAMVIDCGTGTNVCKTIWDQHVVV